MSITDKFGSAVGNMSLENSEKARKLLLTGYRLQEKRLLFFPDRGLPTSGQYAARLVMKRIIQALEKPENAAMVSIFVPGELLTAAGLTPYSVEALSCFMAGTKCEQTFLRKTEDHVLLPQSISGGCADRIAAKAQMHGLYQPGL